MRSNQLGCSGPASAAWLIRRQKLVSAWRAPLRPPSDQPYVKTTAFMAPALVALMPSNMTRSSSANRSSTLQGGGAHGAFTDRKNTRLNSSHTLISYAAFCSKKKNPTPAHKHKPVLTPYT